MAPSERGPCLISNVREDQAMPNAIVQMIMLIYRGRIQQFTTVSHAVQFLQGDAITTGWFRKVTADVHWVTADGVWQAQHLRGHKSAIITALQHLEGDSPRPHP
jgi:hypothetical protein